MVKFNPDIHQRHSIRLADYNYAKGGAYFVTVSTYGRECLFGEIVDGVMVLNRFGEIVRECWVAIQEHFEKVRFDEYVAMPNHVHGIIFVCDVGATHASPNEGAAHERARHASPLPMGPSPRSLGAIVGSFKSAVTKQINHARDNPGCPVWQRNYHERVIRNDRELAAIREYIVNNPMKWEMDKENPANQAP